MARIKAIQKRNAARSRLLESRVDDFGRNLQYRLSETDRLKREILKGIAEESKSKCEKCASRPHAKACIPKSRNIMEHKRHGLRLQHSVEDGWDSHQERVGAHKPRPERSHSDNSMKVNHAEHANSVATSRGHSTLVDNRCHATLADLKLSQSFKRSSHAMSNNNKPSSACSESKLGSLAHYQIHGDFHTGKPLLKHAEMTVNHGSTKMAEHGDANVSSDTNLTAFLFSRHCRHGYVMKKAPEPNERTTDSLKSKIRAKVVKNYLLQDVFKRLNSTKSMAVTGKATEGRHSTHAGLTPETIRRLEQCRYLRLPQKKTIQGVEDTGDKGDDKLPDVDVK